jgi:hypothetical protein
MPATMRFELLERAERDARIRIGRECHDADFADPHIHHFAQRQARRPSRQSSVEHAERERHPADVSAIDRFENVPRGAGVRRIDFHLEPGACFPQDQRAGFIRPSTFDVS